MTSPTDPGPPLPGTGRGAPPHPELGPYAVMGPYRQAGSDRGVAAAAPPRPEPVAPEERCPTCATPVSRSWLRCTTCGTRLAGSAELPAGQLVGQRYEVGRVIGRGGFGITYEAVDRRLHRPVALKELFPENGVRHQRMVLVAPEARDAFAAARDRFLREARVLAQFSHPGIVRVYEVFEEQGTAYLVLEMLRGRTLAQHQRDRGGPLPEAEVLDLAARLGDALGTIHRAGLLHRDVSPSNVVLVGDGRAVLIDFGLARTFDAAHTASMTRIVTPGYAPLEQYRGSGRFGPPTDVYGLAATCYRLLTGEAPTIAVAREAGEPLPSPRRLNPSVSRLVSDAVMDGLELEAGHRPQSIDAFLARMGIDEATAVRLLFLPDTGDAPADPTPPPDPSPPEPAPRVAPTAAASVPLAAAASAAPRVPPPVAGVYVPQVVHHPVPQALPPGAWAGAWPGPDARGPGPYGAPSPHPLARRPPERRWRVAVPLGLVGVAAVSALPLVGLAVVGLVALPALATVGDLALRAWEQPRWWVRASTGAAAVVRFGRNVGLGAARALLPALVAAAGAFFWTLLDDRDATRDVAEPMLRLAAVIAGLLLVVPGLRGTGRFRSGAGTDVVLGQIGVDRRPTLRLVVLWLICGGLAAALFWFRPDPWPIQ